MRGGERGSGKRGMRGSKRCKRLNQQSGLSILQTDADFTYLRVEAMNIHIQAHAYIHQPDMNI